MLATPERFFYIVSATNYIVFKRDDKGKVVCKAMPSPKLTKMLQAQTEIKYSMLKIFSDALT